MSTIYFPSLPPSLFPENELLDYIKVLLANKKTLLQVNSDLRLTVLHRSGMAGSVSRGS